MGIPVEIKSSTHQAANPLGTNGLVFAEFSAQDASSIQAAFQSTGFEPVAEHARKSVTVWRQGGVDFLLNTEAASHGGEFARAHGPCISALGFRVADSAAALSRALSCGAAEYVGAAPRVIDAPAIVGIGGSLIYLIDERAEHDYLSNAFPKLQQVPTVRGFGVKAIDHLTHNVVVGNVDKWTTFYEDVFGFREIWYFHGTGKATGFRTKALKSPCGKICIPVNEPSEPESQIQEWINDYRGEGVQHLAFLTDDLPQTIEAVSQHNVQFMPIPAAYYANMDARLPAHGQDTARLQRNGILLDGTQDASGRWELLLQIFSKNLIGPIFFEFIERNGNEGFGEGNAKALFEAIERDQIERGVVTT